jgi:ABC-type antimicrobial peptide transport system permease subunit
LISFSISNRKKEIGILSALGTASKDIMKIFAVETVIISGIAYVVNQNAAIVSMVLFNNLFSRGFLLPISIFMINIFTFITPVLSAFGLLLLAARLPIRKISKLKPIDAIKNL